jgi:small subunit ribosomal protein S8
VSSPFAGRVTRSPSLVEMVVPSSRMKASIAEILKQEGYIGDYHVEDTKPQATLHIELKYGSERERALQGLRRISKPGLRVYVKRHEIPRVLGGLGVAIVSTSSGLMTDREARRQGRGGEVVAYVW